MDSGPYGTPPGPSTPTGVMPGPLTPTFAGPPSFPGPSPGPPPHTPGGGPPQLIPCGPASGSHGFMGSPAGNSGSSTPGPCGLGSNMPPSSMPGPGMGVGPLGPAGHNGLGPGTMSGLEPGGSQMVPLGHLGTGPMGSSNLMPPNGPPNCLTPNHCGPPPPNSFNNPQFNGLGPCGPCMPNSPSNCGPPPSHLRGQSPSRPGSSGPPFVPTSASPFPFGPNGPSSGGMVVPGGPGGGPMNGPPGGPPCGPSQQFIGPLGPPNFGPGHGPGMHPGMSPHGPLGPHGLPHGPPHGPPHGLPHGTPHGPPMGLHGPPFIDRLEPGFRPSRRPMPIPQPDYRIHEINKRLQQRTDESDNLWWDAFATEFFEDDANIILTFCLEDGPKRYSIGRTLIPRYFRSVFEGGVTDLRYELRHPKEAFHNTTITMDCDQCSVVTLHGKPMFTKVYTEGRLIVEFTFDDMMRIKSWHFAVRNTRELIPRSVLTMQELPGMVENLSKNVTRQGLTSTTLNYLRLCVILEPMQELMSRHKAYALSPRDCLKTTLFQKWQKMVAPPAGSPRDSNRGGAVGSGGNKPGRGRVARSTRTASPHPCDSDTGSSKKSARPPNKRRKRKGAAQTATSVSAPGGGVGKKRSPGPNFTLASQDVMVVGEPSLMGGEFGEEDERLISRLENAQYDPAAAAAQASSQGGGGGPGSLHPPGGGPMGLMGPMGPHGLPVEDPNFMGGRPPLGWHPGGSLQSGGGPSGPPIPMQPLQPKTEPDIKKSPQN